MSVLFALGLILSACGGNGDAGSDVGNAEAGAMAAVFDSWSRSSRMHRPNKPATAADFEGAAKALGTAFPSSFKTLYERSNGGSFVEGDLMLEPLVVGKEWTGVVGLTRSMQKEWNIPEELVVFGSDGSDSTFALWIPTGRPESRDAPVVMVGEGGEGFAVAGTTLTTFLKGRTAYYLMVGEADKEALDALWGASSP